jgi:hypothetical protein
VVVEHSFVTTLESADALRRASDFLKLHGFEALTGGAFQIGQAGWTTLEMRRGRRNAARAKSISQLPQSIRLDFDRGRIIVAASITPSSIWGGSSWTRIGFGLDRGVPEVAKKMRVHADLLTAIANGLELHLAKGVQAPIAAAQWSAIETYIQHLARKRRRRQWLLGLLIILIFAALVAVIVMAANPHR